MENISKVTILNFPSFWMTFYLKGLKLNFKDKLVYNLEVKYSNYNFKNVIILNIEINDKSSIVAIDSEDPSPYHFDYNTSDIDFVFLNQYLLNSKDKYADKIYPLLPHTPIFSNFYILIALSSMLKDLDKMKIVKNIYGCLKMKKLESFFIDKIPVKKGFVFYYRSLWKKELNTNLLGAIFLESFTKLGYDVIGGLFRSDDFKTDVSVIDKYIIKKKLSNKKYLNYLAQSEFCFLSPAVRGAISWRFAEYLFFNKKIVCTPFEVWYPSELNLILISGNLNTMESEILEKKDINCNNSDFVVNCLLPNKQIDYIINTLWKKI